MNPAEAPQTVAQAFPNSFDCVRDLSNAVSISVLGSRRRVFDSFPASGCLSVFQPQIRAILVGKEAGLLCRFSGICCPNGLFLGVETDPKVGPPSFATNHPDDRRPVVLVGPPSSGFVGPPAGRASGFRCGLDFFPRSATSHRLRLLDPAAHPSAPAGSPTRSPRWTVSFPR